MATDSHLTGLADEMAKLLVSGDYSDLTLRCSDGAELPVHRNVVCRRSTVLAAACSGRFTVNDFHEKPHFQLFLPSYFPFILESRSFTTWALHQPVSSWRSLFVLEERSLLEDVPDGLQEATTGVVGVTDFDSNTVRRMLAFFYTGEYEDGQVNGTGAGAALIGAAAYGTLLWLKADSRTSLLGRRYHFC
jgi:hypothetical protein